MNFSTYSTRRGFPLILTALVSYLLLWPVDIQPLAWTPPASPEPIGVWSPNEQLKSLKIIHSSSCLGCEDIAIDSLGKIYAGTKDGFLIRMTESNTDTLLSTGGRALGLAWDPQHRLIIADGIMGLLRYTVENNKLELLTDNFQHNTFGLTDDIDVAPNGMIYFSDASDRWPINELRTDFLEHGANGALYSYNPLSETTELLVDDGYFTNGVAVSSDGQYLLYNETSAYRVWKYYLKGPQTGQRELFLEGLPGMPDGISRAPDGSFWLTLVYPRQKTLDFALPRPWLRKLFRRLPTRLLPKPTYANCIVQIDQEGRVLRTLQDEAPEFHSISSVEQLGNTLYFGTLEDEGIGTLDLSRLK